MSVTTLNYNRTVDGIPTDATSVALSDPTGSFGVLRKDTNGVVVAAGTAFVKTGTGQYEWAFVDPAPDLVYRYFIKVIADGGTNYYERETSIAATLYEYDGRYASYSGMIRKFGRMAVNRWAEVNGSIDTEATKAAIESAINSADAFVDTYLQDGPYTVPFTSPPLTIRETANIIAAASLYEARGMVDFDPTSETGNRVSGLRAQAMRLLGQIKSGRVKLVTDAGLELYHASSLPGAGSFDCGYLSGYSLSYYDSWPESN